MPVHDAMPLTQTRISRTSGLCTSWFYGINQNQACQNAIHIDLVKVHPPPPPSPPRGRAGRKLAAPFRHALGWFSNIQSHKSQCVATVQSMTLRSLGAKLAVHPLEPCHVGFFPVLKFLQSSSLTSLSVRATVGSMGPGSHTQWSTFRGSSEESYSSRQSYIGGLQDRAAQMINRRFVPALKAAGIEHEVRIRYSVSILFHRVPI